MRRFINIVNEAFRPIMEAKSTVVKTSGGDVIKVYIDPTRSELLALAEKHSMRGTSDGQSIFLWGDASEIHFHMTQYFKTHHIGNFAYENRNFSVYDFYVFFDDSDRAAPTENLTLLTDGKQFISNHVLIATLYGNPRMLSEVKAITRIIDRVPEEM